MKLLNVLEVDTRWGYRPFELWHGDITKFESGIDLLVVSSIGPSVAPVPGTVIGSLKKIGVDVSKFQEHPEVDLVQALGSWVSKSTESRRIARIMCVQIPFGGSNASQIVENAFLALPLLDARGISLSTVALPLLGAGNNPVHPEILVQPILEGARNAIKSVKSVRRVCFIELDESRAASLSDEMDRVLGRVGVALAKGELVNAIRSEADFRLQQLEELDRTRNTAETLASLRDAIFKDSRSIDLGIAVRRFTELVVAGIVSKADQKKDLWGQIEALRHYPVAPWILSYMNVLREFGNEGAHHKRKDKFPHTISSEDLALCLFAVERVLDFWIEWRRKPPKGELQ